MKPCFSKKPFLKLTGNDHFMNAFVALGTVVRPENMGIVPDMFREEFITTA